MARWVAATLAVIALVIAGGFAAGAVGAAHELATVDCTGMTNERADGTVLALLVPRAHPCADLKDELLATRYARELEAAAAGFAGVCLALVAVSRRRAG